MSLLRQYAVSTFSAGVGLTFAIGNATATEPSQASRMQQLYVARGVDAQDCPDAAQLAENVGDRLGRATLMPTVDPLTSGYWVQVDKSGQGYRASIRGVGAVQGIREAADPGPTCAALAEAIAVTLAILVDRPETETQVARAATPISSPRKPLGAKGLPVQRSAPPKRWGQGVDERVVAGAGGAFGLPTTATFALHSEIYFAWARWVVGGGAVWLAPSAVSYGPGSVTVSHLAGYARACASLWRSDDSSLQGCAFPMVGVVQGEGHGYSPDRKSTDLWISLGPGLVFDTRVWGRLHWETRTVGLIPVRRQRYSLDRGGAAYESPLAGVLLASSLALSIW